MEGSDFDLLYAAGNARSIGDWLLGMNATRLYTLKYANGKGVLSIGRVQTPTLALIVKRHKEITEFVSEPFWELKTTYREVLFSATQGRFQVKEDAEAFLEKIRDDEFEIVSFTRKKGTEAPPKLFDLTSLQVECNKKFAFTADETLQHIQKLYERKLVTYPRVDTTFLPNAMHAKIKGILEKLKPYENFIKPLLTEPIRKTKKVFDDKKITDHHAIIPTGIMPSGLVYHEKQVYDTIARRFIAAFYPDCVVSNTTVIGETAGVEFKATGKVIMEPGWRELYPKKETETNSDEEGQLMPEFVKGERGPHTSDLQEKQTQPPKPYTEATLLRAMETAGKQVDDEELSELMKENGIGRPSTRANIIETLFKRKYVSRERKNLVPTITGIQLIETIQNDLLKSVELTGMWEKKLRLIENGEYDAKNFLDEMKLMVSDLVKEVKQERRQAITIEEEKVESGKRKAENGERKLEKGKQETKDVITCPKCGKGTMLKGKTAFGCSEYKAGCQFVVPFEQFGKILTDKQIEALLTKKLTGQISGFVVNGEKTKGVLTLSNDFTVEIEFKPAARDTNQLLTCPKCGQGTLLKGKAAYGCSRFREGCRFVVPFADLESRFATHELNAEHLKAFI
jgi:DNA topoisomerase-3